MPLLVVVAIALSGDGDTWACNFDNKKHIAINNSFPTSFCWIKPYNSCNYDYTGVIVPLVVLRSVFDTVRIGRLD
jgi:hypothetical protein